MPGQQSQRPKQKIGASRMKLTKSKLKQIIKEEINSVMKEGWNPFKKEKYVDPWQKAFLPGGGMHKAIQAQDKAHYGSKDVMEEWMKNNHGWITKWEPITEKEWPGENPTPDEYEGTPDVDTGVKVWGKLASGTPDGSDEIEWRERSTFKEKLSDLDNIRDQIDEFGSRGGKRY